jgi:hypothetical protein
MCSNYMIVYKCDYLYLEGGVLRPSICYCHLALGMGSHVLIEISWKWIAPYWTD